MKRAARIVLDLASGKLAKETGKHQGLGRQVRDMEGREKARVVVKMDTRATSGKRRRFGSQVKRLSQRASTGRMDRYMKP